MRIKSVFSIIMMLFISFTSAFAQAVEVTKIHEDDIMNQFLTMETGAGALTPAAYYNLFHKSYQKDANARNKLFYRTLAMAAVNEEKEPAAKIDSDYVARGKVEALNIESRSKATDTSWASEKSKVNGKLEMFNRNINLIQPSGGTPEDYRTWRNIYNCIETAIKYTQDSQQLQIWKGGKRAQEILNDKTKIQRLSSTKVVASNALRRWQTAFGVNGIHTGK